MQTRTFFFHPSAFSRGLVEDFFPSLNELLIHSIHHQFLVASIRINNLNQLGRFQISFQGTSAAANALVFFKKYKIQH